MASVITAADKRAFLRVLYLRARSDSLPLYRSLLDFLESKVSRTEGGLHLTSTSGNGRSQTFATPDSFANSTPDELRVLANELIEVYEDACSTLSLTVPEPETTDTANDANIFAEMKADDRLQSIRDYVHSYTNLRQAGGVP